MPKITDITAQAKNVNRVNVFIDGKYTFSLDLYQVSQLGIKIGTDFDENQLQELEAESQFGKLYSRALEYCLMRPHSAKEVRDYLWRKTRSSKVRRRDTGEVYDRPGVPKDIADRVYDRLVEKTYIDDDQFTRFWLLNRHQTKGASKRKLIAELRAKGVEQSTIERHMSDSDRSDASELEKMIRKKRTKYADEQKLLQYLARQGFSYDDIKTALSAEDDT